MALPEAIGATECLNLPETARRLGIDPVDLLALMIRARLLYRYSGVGRPLAYIRCVRAGLFINTPTDVRITPRGLDLILGGQTGIGDELLRWKS